MNLLDLLQQDGFQCTRVSARDGGEYSSPCPWCGGTDRFHIWPGRGGADGSFWCRQCKVQGDPIQYLRDFRGMSYSDACRTLGIEPTSQYATAGHGGCTGRNGRTRPTQGRTTSSSSCPAASPGWTPKDSSTPAGVWQAKAASVEEWAERQLWSAPGKAVLAWLHGQRFLDDAAIKSARLGWIPADLYRDRSAWGLPEEIKENGRPKRLWLPAGLVIPCRDGEGHVVRLRVRRPEPGEGPRYYTLPGSSMRPMVCGSERGTVMVVESELDALLVHQEAGDLLTVLALGSAQMRPDTATTEILRRAETVLVSLDSDEAGGKESWSWWMTYFPNARRWPCIEAKDPTEMMGAGIQIRIWVEAALMPADADGGPQPGETGAEETRPATTAEVRCYDCEHFTPGRFIKLPGNCGGMPHDGNASQPALDVHPCQGFREKGAAQ